MVATSMMPMFAFATEQEPAGATEENTTVTDGQNPSATDEQNQPSTEEQNSTTTDGQNPELTVQEATPEISVAEEDLSLREFTDTGEIYLPDSGQFAPTMRIYGIYLPGGNYGDAVLIESNGKYLLMDTGHTDASNTLVTALRNIGVSELDVYISHMHGDHFGGLEAVCRNFKVNRLYLPDIELCQEYETPEAKKSIDQIYKEQTDIARKDTSKGTKVIYLRPEAKGTVTEPRVSPVYNQFSVGGASCTVIGPVGTHHLGEFSKNLYYLNNTSLCTIIQCGNFRYMTCGDLQKDEDGNLTNYYGYGLNCDMLKLSHHGLSNANSDYFLSRVSPMWSFAENHGYSSSQTSSSFGTAGRYGFVYGVASNARNYIVDVQYNAVRLFKDWNYNGRIDEAPITGWVKCGSGYQYYDGAGYIHTGWNWISGYAYYMSGSSGFRYTGSNRINGVKVKFSSSGKLTSHSKPSKVRISSGKAYKGTKIKIKWRKASRASAYQVFRATSKNGAYTYMGTFSKGKRSYSDWGIVKGQKYYYKVKAIRYVAGGVMYGSNSSAKKIRAK